MTDSSCNMNNISNPSISSQIYEKLSNSVFERIFSKAKNVLDESKVSDLRNRWLQQLQQQKANIIANSESIKDSNVNNDTVLLKRQRLSNRLTEAVPSNKKLFNICGSNGKAIDKIQTTKTENIQIIYTVKRVRHFFSYSTLPFSIESPHYSKIIFI